MGIPFQAGQQLLPGASAVTALYTCPAGYAVEVSLLLADVSGNSHTFGISVSRYIPGFGNEADDLKQYIVYGATLPAHETRGVAGLTLNEHEELRAYASGTTDEVAASVFLEGLKQVLA